ncbi:MAG: hypothetical protein HOC74_43900 [Gemmatimonadetes bacterium]|jgi:flagellar motor component MotA|nr:hypothetical protein [Gemmatimonadota bacterium]MBT7914178.1 hypothetical protein [Candidatus Bathyarchaeota archaeon]
MSKGKAPKAEKTAKRKPSKKYLTQKINWKKKLQHTPVSQMDMDDLREITVGLAEVAHTEGREAVEKMLPADDPQDKLFLLGMQLAVDGADPSLIAGILATRMRTYLQQQEMRCHMIIEAVASVQALDSPRIVDLKLRSHYNL